MDLLDLINLGWFGALALLLHVLAIGNLLTFERRQPSATFAWLLALIFLPLLGLVLFHLFSGTRLRRLESRAQKATEAVIGTLKDSGVLGRLRYDAEDADSKVRALIRLCTRLSSTPATCGNAVRILQNGPATYRALFDSLEHATDHVHVLFYIVQPDESGEGLRDRLVRLAARGVKVRVLCDALGSANLPSDFWQPLFRAGGDARFFRPVWSLLARGRRGDRVDFRNHRKIVVVDGKVGFTGGINMGREYLGLDPTRGKWRDTHIELKGPSVLGLQAAFAEDWHYTTGELLDPLAYFRDPDESPGDSIVQIVDSGPDRRWSPIEFVFDQAFSAADNRIWVTSPYMIPNPVIENALLGAALRGVDVRLMVPAKADRLIVQYASRFHYPTMLAAGIQIHEYEPGFMHAKTIIVDDWMGSVGSANMDMRSFHLNFELNAFVFDKPFCDELAAQFRRDLEQATQIHAPETNGFRRLLHRSAHLVSPLL